MRQERKRLAQSPVKKYAETRDKIVKNLKCKDYWPETMKRPEDYRTFYWTNDLAFCGFATVTHQGKTIELIQKATQTRKKSRRRKTKPKHEKNQENLNASEKVRQSQEAPKLIDLGEKVIVDPQSELFTNAEA